MNGLLAKVWHRDSSAPGVVEVGRLRRVHPGRTLRPGGHPYESLIVCDQDRKYFVIRKDNLEFGLRSRSQLNPRSPRFNSEAEARKYYEQPRRRLTLDDLRQLKPRNFGSRPDSVDRDVAASKNPERAKRTLESYAKTVALQTYPGAIAVYVGHKSGRGDWEIYSTGPESKLLKVIDAKTFRGITIPERNRALELESQGIEYLAVGRGWKFPINAATISQMQPTQLGF